MMDTTATSSADPQIILAITDFIIANGTNKTSSGNWITDFSDIPIEIASSAFVESNAQSISDMLASREEVLDIEIDGNSFDIVYGLAYCPNLEAETEDISDVEEAEKGYVIAICDDSDFYIPNAEHIERNDSLTPWIYDDDAEAAKGAEMDGVKLIYGMNGVQDGVYIDTPTNRKAIETTLQKDLPKPSILETLKANAEKSRQQSEAKQDNKKSKEMEM